MNAAEEKDPPATIPVYTALNKPILFLGCDRKVILFIGLVCAAMVFQMFQWTAFFFGVGLWVFSLFILQRVAKADPLMRQVYLRHIKYQKYYAPTSTPFVVPSAMTKRKMAVAPWNRSLE